MGIVDAVLELGSKGFYVGLEPTSRKRSTHSPEADQRRNQELSAYFSGLRNQVGLAQQEVAARMGTTQSVISRFESGWSNPTLDFMHRYCLALGVKVSLSLTKSDS